MPFAHIRPAMQTDISLFTTYEGSVSHPYIGAWPEAVHKKNMADQAFHYLIAADHEGQAIGYAILKETDSVRMEFLRIAMTKPNTGGGQPFMKAVLAYIQDKCDQNTVWLDVYEANKRARHVYEKLGFHVTHTEDAPTTAPKEFGQLVFMEKDLA